MGVKRLIGSGDSNEDAYGYSRAVVVGHTCWVSGTTARGDALMEGAGPQLRDAAATVEAALEEAGFRLDDVVRSTVYLTDMDDEPSVAEVHREVFGTARPASTLVQVVALSPAEARVELQVTAAREHG